MFNPVAPIGHHWLDATHISFGVLTAGVSSAAWKAEASIFNGREPDEQRTDVDLAALDSYSARVSYAPMARLSVQVSAGHLEEAEAPHGAGARLDVIRVTASAIYSVPRAAGGYWASTLAWGANREDGETSHALLLETTLSPRGTQTWFARLETTGKPAHALHVHESSDVFTVGKLQGGYIRYWRAWGGVEAGVGGTISAALLPAALAPRYGGHMVPGFGVFATFRPPAR
jgi:hypothetical protein